MSLPPDLLPDQPLARPAYQPQDLPLHRLLDLRPALPQAPQPYLRPSQLKRLQLAQLLGLLSDQPVSPPQVLRLSPLLDQPLFPPSDLQLAQL